MNKLILSFFVFLYVTTNVIAQSRILQFDKEMTHRRSLRIKENVKTEKRISIDTTGHRGGVDIRTYDVFGRLLIDKEMSGESKEECNSWHEWNWSDTSYVISYFYLDTIVSSYNYVFDFNKLKLSEFSYDFTTKKCDTSIFGIYKNGQIKYWPDTSVQDTVEMVIWNERNEFVGIDLLVSNKIIQSIWKEERKDNLRKTICNKSIVDRCGNSVIEYFLYDSLGFVTSLVGCDSKGDTVEFMKYSYDYDDFGNWIKRYRWFSKEQQKPYITIRELTYFTKEEIERMGGIVSVFPVTFRLDHGEL